MYHKVKVTSGGTVPGWEIIKIIAAQLHDVMDAIVERGEEDKMMFYEFSRAIAQMRDERAMEDLNGHDGYTDVALAKVYFQARDTCPAIEA